MLTRALLFSGILGLVLAAFILPAKQADVVSAAGDLVLGGTFSGSQNLHNGTCTHQFRVIISNTGLDQSEGYTVFLRDNSDPTNFLSKRPVKHGTAPGEITIKTLRHRVPAGTDITFRIDLGDNPASPLIRLRTCSTI